jgi:hypothetical protein
MSVVAPKKISRSSWRRRSRRLRATAHEHALLGEGAVGVERRVGLGDDVLLLLVGGR